MSGETMPWILEHHTILACLGAGFGNDARRERRTTSDSACNQGCEHLAHNM